MRGAVIPAVAILCPVLAGGLPASGAALPFSPASLEQGERRAMRGSCRR
jgi:hypothetical protein